MNRIDVICKISIYEINNKDVDSYTNRFGIQSHALFDDRVILIVDDRKYTVIGSDLIRAVENCMRTK